MELRKKILDLGKQRNMTQDEFAEALFVSRQTVYKWESGRALPDVDRLRQISDLFGVSAVFCLAQKSFLNSKPILEAADASFRHKALITRQESVCAAYRLNGSW